MKEITYVLTLIMFLAVGILASPSTFAQAPLNPPPIDQQIQPGTGAITDDTMNDTTNNTAAGATTDGFNLLWLLPLIAIPLLAYLLWPRGKTTEMEDKSYSEYAGAKGGKGERDSSDTTEI